MTQAAVDGAAPEVQTEFDRLWQALDSLNTHVQDIDQRMVCVSRAQAAPSPDYRMGEPFGDVTLPGVAPAEGPCSCDEALELRAELSEWTRCGASVGVTCVGRMQQAKHMADAAVQALGLVWDETAPSDITEGIAALRATAHGLEKQVAGCLDVRVDLRAEVTRLRSALEHIGQGSSAATRKFIANTLAECSTT